MTDTKPRAYLPVGPTPHLQSDVRNGAPTPHDRQMADDLRTLGAILDDTERDCFPWVSDAEYAALERLANLQRDKDSDHDLYNDDDEPCLDAPDD